MHKPIGWMLILSILMLAACGSSSAGSSITPTTAVNEPASLVAPEVNPRLALSPQSAAPSQQVMITGDGWPPNTSVALTFRPGSTVIGIPLDLGATNVDMRGLFSFGFNVPPDAAPGDWIVRAAANSREIQIATAPFTVLPSPAAQATGNATGNSAGTAATMPTSLPTAVPPSPVAPTLTPVVEVAEMATATAAPTETTAPALIVIPPIPPAPTVAATHTPASEAMPAPTQPANPQRVRFPVGATSITLPVQLNPGVPVTYVLGILQGQTLTIQVTPAAHISVLDIQNQTLASANQTLSLPVPYTGDYIIVINSPTIADPAIVQISIPPPPQARAP